MKTEKVYTTQLQAGLGMIEETKTLLALWTPGMSTADLLRLSLNTGSFPNITARRLRNVICECFAPRYLLNKNYPAEFIKVLMDYLNNNELRQLLFIYTARANSIFYDFVLETYWDRYSNGHNSISNEESVNYVIKANQNGLTQRFWSESTIRRVAGYLTGCCADFILLESGQKKSRKILGYRIESRIAAYLAYDLHFSGFGDNSIISHSDWLLFGLQGYDVKEELQRLALRGYLIIQSIGEVVRISWTYNNWEELLYAISKG